MRGTRHALILLSLAVLMSGCASGLRVASEGEAVKNLTIRWQRLVDAEGKTCDRCGTTEQEVKKASKALKKSLAPVGIHVSLVERELTPEECSRDISESNRIWIGDRPLEDWLGAQVGMSQCESCCGELGEEVECRTVSVDGNTYEAIPAELIVKAGLLAASEIMQTPSPNQCCPSQGKAAGTNGECCPSHGKAADKNGECCPTAKKPADKSGDQSQK